MRSQWLFSGVRAVSFFSSQCQTSEGYLVASKLLGETRVAVVVAASTLHTVTSVAGKRCQFLQLPDQDRSMVSF